MMQTQQQPALDTPAEVKAPVVEHVVETARRVSDTRTGILLPILLSFILSTGAGVLVAYLFNLAFNPTTPGFVSLKSRGLSQAGVFLPIGVAFILGLVFPVLFGGRKRVLCMLMTIILQFIALAVLVFVGLSQLSLPQMATLHLS
jgi:hypothetical protein